MRRGRKFRHGNSLLEIVLHTFLLAILACCFVGCASQGGMSGMSLEQQNYADVQFVYIDHNARSVCLAGNFNGWSKNSSCMKKNGNTWSVQIELTPGRYQYLFLVDGRKWRQDPGALLHESNGFGGENSILIVD